MFKFLKDLFKVPAPKAKVETPTFKTDVIPDNFEVKYEFNDNKAIKIMQNNIKLGYIPRKSPLQGLIHKFYENGCVVVATLKKINPKNILLDIKLYDSTENKYISTNCKLTSIKKSYKENWDYVNYNEVLDIECYDDKYTIINKFSEPLGSLGKKITKDFYIYKELFCYADYINYEYDNYGDKIVSSVDLVVTRIE